MSLSERLAAAAKARDAGTGLAMPPVATDSAPAPGSTVVAQARPARPGPSASSVATVARPGPRIIAPASTPVDVVTPDPDASPTSICPTCGRTGELGMVDLPGQTADWSCLSCGTLWQVSLSE